MWAFYIFLAILLTPAAVVVGVYSSRIRFSRRIVARTQPAQQTPSRCRRVIVVAGDSTAFGVGARDRLPRDARAGRDVRRPLSQSHGRAIPARAAPVLLPGRVASLRRGLCPLVRGSPLERPARALPRRAILRLRLAGRHEAK